MEGAKLGSVRRAGRLGAAGAIVAAVAALAAAGVAQASAKMLSGGFDSDPNAAIELRVKVDAEGAPVRVKRISYSGVDVRCGNGDGFEVSGSTRGGKVKQQNQGRPYFLGGGPDSDPKVNVYGEINRRATKVRGDMLVVADSPDGCTTGSPDAPQALDFVARR